MCGALLTWALVCASALASGATPGSSDAGQGGMRGGSPPSRPTPRPNLAPPEGGDARGDFESRMGFNKTDMPSFIPDGVRQRLDGLMSQSDKGAEISRRWVWACGACGPHDTYTNQQAPLARCTAGVIRLLILLACSRAHPLGPAGNAQGRRRCRRRGAKRVSCG
jgi:hypothetical protein